MKLLVRCVLFFMLLGAASSVAVAGDLALELVGRETCRQADVLVTISVNGRPSEYHGSLVGGRAVLTAQLPEDNVGSIGVRAEAEGCWAAPLEVESTAPAASMELVPAGWVTGSVKLQERGVPLPHRLALSLHRAPDADPERQLSEAHVECEVTEGHLAECTVPAGRWSLRASVEGWAPVYRWDVEVPPGHRVPLGTLVFRRGGSIAGEVTAEDGLPQGLDVTVVAHPLMEAASLQPGERQRLQHLDLRTTARAFGKFGLSGVPPGRYRLRADAPPYAPASVVVDVEKGRETILDSALVLRPPVRLVVDVTPESARGDAAWTIDLFSEEESREFLRRDGGPTRSGRWTSSPLPPGEYWIQVSGPDGGRLAMQRVDLQDDLQPEAVELELVRVHGTVELGDREIAARLWFGGRTGEERIETRSELERGFDVMLPHPGTWRVDVLAEDPAVDRQGVEVTVNADSVGESDDLVVRLPDTTLEGDVVNEEGVPVGGAIVNLVRLDPLSRVSLRTDETGWFEDHGLDPGAYELDALGDQMRSDRVRVAVTEGVSVPVRLVLRKVTTLRGRVLSPSGPVPGAGVLAYPLVVGGGAASTTIPQGASGPDGRFQLDVPAQAGVVRLVALAPGYVFALQRVDVEGDRSQELEVPVRQGGGTLVIDPGASGGAARFAVVYVSGEPVDLALLRLWVSLNGGQAWQGPVRAPAMPAGEYVACRVTPQEAMAVIGGLAAPRASSCVQGDLLEGSSLELVLP